MFATLSTLSADGSPLQAVVWYALRGDAVLVNSAVGRHWPTNLCRDPRYSFLVEDGYEWVGLRGRAEVLDDPEQAQADIAALARQYLDPDAAKAIIHDTFQPQERISFLLHPASVTEHRD
jgi:PPOX class probable F420-dependent enzyme